MNWYDEEARTTVERHEFKGHPNCRCNLCVLHREELPAQRIERRLRAIVLDLGGMSLAGLMCAEAHVTTKLKSEVAERRHLGHMLGHLAAHIRQVRMLRTAGE